MHQATLVSSLLAALVLAGCQTGTPTAPAQAAAPQPMADETFEPAKGVSCNRGSGRCEWRGGTSVGLTRLFFGDAAADAAEPTMRAAHFPHDPIFKPNPGASCDTLVTTCYDRGGASDALTSNYFGAEAARRLAERRAQVVRYGQHVTCDQTTQTCFDRFGAGVGITQLYIGAAESQSLLARLRAQDS
ncbi:MAG: hypothetical protein JRH16_18540 [Deltaproteobacteria bacterium]|nr:hypothetical protein [Deltaproteobacteria bacterium]